MPLYLEIVFMPFLLNKDCVHFIKINWLEDVIKSRETQSDRTVMKKVSFLHTALPQTQHLQVMFVTVAIHYILGWLEQGFQDTLWSTTEPYLLSPGIFNQLFFSPKQMFR